MISKKTPFNLEGLSDTAEGLRLCRIDKRGHLLLYESAMFDRKRAAVMLVLRRARICGRMETDAELDTYFADIVDGTGDIEHTVSLDYGSFNYLKRKLRPLRDS